MEAHFKVPEVSAFGTDVLLLIVPDSAHTPHTPISWESSYRYGNQFSHQSRVRKSKQTMEYELNSDHISHEIGSIGKS